MVHQTLGSYLLPLAHASLRQDVDLAPLLERFGDAQAVLNGCHDPCS
jgi:hypothetical protein